MWRGCNLTKVEMQPPRYTIFCQKLTISACPGGVARLKLDRLLTGNFRMRACQLQTFKLARPVCTEKVGHWAMSR